MKLREVIEFVDGIKPNGVTEAQKTKWVNDCEGMVQTQILLFAPQEMMAYSWERDRDAELLVSPPHDKLYVSYLCAMVDYMNGEYGKYQNSMQMFNAEFAEFMRWFANTYRPADTYEEESE